MDADENDYESGADSYPTNDGDTDTAPRQSSMATEQLPTSRGSTATLRPVTHEVYSDLDSYMYGGEPTWSRDADDPESYGRD